MADDPNHPPAKGDPPPDPKPDLGDAGKKALDDERKARREAERQLADAQRQLKDLTDKDKSEVEKLRDEVSKLTKERDTHASSILRLEVATAKGLNAAQVKRLVGNTKEELEADADEILEAFPAQSGGAKPPPSQRPRTDLRGGIEPNDEPVETDPAKLAASVPRY